MELITGGDGSAYGDEVEQLTVLYKKEKKKPHPEPHQEEGDCPKLQDSGHSATAG